MNELDFLEITERLLPSWSGVLSPEDAQKLATWLQETPRDDPEAVRQTVNRALDVLQRYPGPKTDLGQELNPEDPQEGMRLLFSPNAGEPQVVEARTVMVCPQASCQYQRILMVQGERLFCPQHRVALVPKSSLSAKE
jgi:hypothetical protein